MELVFEAKRNDRRCKITASQPEGLRSAHVLLQVEWYMDTQEDKPIIDLFLIRPDHLRAIAEFFK